MIYLYGLFEGMPHDLTAALEGAQGLQAALTISPVGPWFLVHSDHDDQEVLPKRRWMLTHTKVLERMIKVGTVLPARFGLVADDLPTATALITAQEKLVLQEFEHVRGHVELGIRISFPRGPALKALLASNPALKAERDALAGKGAEAHYAIAAFGGQLAEQLDRRRAGAQSALLAALTPAAHAHVLRKPEEDTEVLRAEFLIPADAQERFVALVEAAVAELTFAPGADPSIQVIGPVPMYNFVQLSLTLSPDTMVA